MAVLTAEELEARRNQLIEEVEKYRTQVTDALDGVADALKRGEYPRACSVMATLSAHQARTSVMMRAVLIKNGFMGQERDDV